MKTLIVGSEEVKQLLPMSECIQVMTDMFKTLSSNSQVITFLLPPRRVISQPDGTGALALMPAFLAGKTQPSIGAKVITLFPGNLDTPYDTHQGAVLLFESQNGRLQALIDAVSITKVRTAAVSAVATQMLARKDASRLAILGSGAQAASHLEAMLLVRHISSVKVWSRNPEHAKHFAERYSSSLQSTPIGKSQTSAPLASSSKSSYSSSLRMTKIEVESSVQEAVKDADIICTTTSSKEPILEGRWLPEGAHINAVGAYTPSTRELDSEAIARSLLFVDSREFARKEAGEFVIALKEGVITVSHIKGELGEILTKKAAGRTNERDITLFKSLGLATEDIAAAQHIYSNALLQSSGVWVEFSEERRNGNGELHAKE